MREVLGFMPSTDLFSRCTAWLLCSTPAPRRFVLRNPPMVLCTCQPLRARGWQAGRWQRELQTVLPLEQCAQAAAAARQSASLARRCLRLIPVFVICVRSVCSAQLCSYVVQHG